MAATVAGRTPRTRAIHSQARPTPHLIDNDDCSRAQAGAFPTASWRLTGYTSCGVFEHPHCGETLPDDGAGRDDLALLVNYILQVNGRVPSR
jgi:hypothetical protein